MKNLLLAIPLLISIAAKANDNSPTVDYLMECNGEPIFRVTSVSPSSLLKEFNPGETVSVQVDALSVRVMPDMNSRLLGLIKKGEHVTIDSAEAVWGSAGGFLNYWYPISSKESLHGWAFGAFLQYPLSATPKFIPLGDFLNGVLDKDLSSFVLASSQAWSYRWKDKALYLDVSGHLFYIDARSSTFYNVVTPVGFDYGSWVYVKNEKVISKGFFDGDSKSGEYFVSFDLEKGRVTDYKEYMRNASEEPVEIKDAKEE